MIRLKIRTTEGEHELSFDTESISIGRHAENDVQLPEKKASRKHAVIEVSGGVPMIVDQGSVNGTLLNGKRVRSQRLTVGDKIRIARSTIEILALPGVEVAEFEPVVLPPLEHLPKPPPPKVRPKSSESTLAEEEHERYARESHIATDLKLKVRRKIDQRVRTSDETRMRARSAGAWRRIAGVAAALVVLLAIVGAVLFLPKLTRIEPTVKKDAAPRREKSPKYTRAEADLALEEFRHKVETAGAVTEALVDRCAQLSRRYAETYRRDGESNPFEQVYNDLAIRREEQTGGVLASLNRRVRIALGKGRFDEAMSVVRKAREENPAITNDHLRHIVAMIDRSAEAAFRTIQARGERLVELKMFEDAARHYKDNLDRFKDTRYHAILAGKPATMEDLHAAEREEIAREREKMKKRWAAPAEKKKEEKAGAPSARTTLSPLSLKALEASEAGKLAGLMLPAGELVSADDCGIEVRKDEGTQKIHWMKVPPESLFVLYRRCGLQGDDLLMLCEFGLFHGLTEKAELCLRDYIGAEEAGERIEKANKLLSRARGEPIPAGGYAWNQKLKTFETPSQIANREARENLKSYSTKLANARNAKVLEQQFERLHALYEDPGLKGEFRARLKQEAVVALRENKKWRLEELARKSKRAAINEKLKMAKRELNKRRQKAIHTIRDTAVYLPEDHIRWDEGPKVNGQEKVDESVRQVLEYWNIPESVSMDSSIRNLVEGIKKINEAYLPAFGERAAFSGLEEFGEVVNNLSVGAKMSIRSYSLNSYEADTYAWNRRVEEYNHGLRSPDIPRKTKEHVGTINDYREMLGLRRCFIDERLCRTAIKHSRTCHKVGQIWHVGSDGTPESRAQAEGFTAGVTENCAIGYSNPDNIWWKGWYRWSDHHRNVLRDNWNCIGYGYVGSVGTQLFAHIGAPEDMKKED
ncbi:MAG: FHA domain-containing protein [Planctomycetota bacterium]|jgi:hypothetical protein